jgi:hypothetical protein
VTKTDEIGPNPTPIIFRSLMIAAGCFMMLLLLSMKNVLLGGLVALVPLFLIVLPSARGLFTWPTRVWFDVEAGELSMRGLIGSDRSIPVRAVRDMQPTLFWSGGRSSFTGLILHLQSGERIRLSSGNLRSVQRVQDILFKAGVPLAERTSTGRKLKR